MNFVALRMLTGDRAKYFGLVFAIAFCTFLLENQTSIFASIMRRTASQILDVTDAEVWVMDPQTEYFDQTKALKDTDLTRVRGVPGVAWAVRLFKGSPVAKTRSGKFAVSIVFGLDDATLSGAPRKMLLGSWERLREPESVVIDQAGYVLLFPGEPLQLGRTLEMNDHRVTIVGISDASAPFVSVPIMHTRYSEAVNFLGRERTQLSFVIARAQAGATPEELAARISSATASARGRTGQFMWDGIGYYLRNTGIPVNFGITIAVAHRGGGGGRGPDLLSLHRGEPEAVRRPQGHGRDEPAAHRHDPAAGRERGRARLRHRHGHGGHVLRDHASANWRRAASS